MREGRRIIKVEGGEVVQVDSNLFIHETSASFCDAWTISLSLALALFWVAGKVLAYLFLLEENCVSPTKSNVSDQYVFWEIGWCKHGF